MAKLPFGQDSMSLIVDDRFFESQSNISNYLLNFNLQNKNTSKQQLQHLSLHSGSQTSIINFKKQHPVAEQILDQGMQNIDSSEMNWHSSSDHHSQSKQAKDEKSSSRQSKNSTILQKKKWNSRIYRQRKKKYISQLEEENSLYKRKCDQLEQKIFMLQRQIAELRFDMDNNQKCGYEKEHKKDIQLLKSLIANPSITNHQLGRIAMKMREKYGPAGKQRRQILNYYMSEYINSTLADFQKYIFHSVLKRTGPFGESRNYLDEKMNEVLSLSQEQKVFIKKNVWNELYPVAVSYSNCCKNIYKNYVNLLDQAKKFHDTMSKGLNYIIVPQLTKLVIWFDQYKNSIEVRKLKQDWIRLFSGQLSPNPQIDQEHQH